MRKVELSAVTIPEHSCSVNAKACNSYISKSCTCVLWVHCILLDRSLIKMFDTMQYYMLISSLQLMLCHIAAIKSPHTSSEQIIYFLVSWDHWAHMEWKWSSIVASAGGWAVLPYNIPTCEQTQLSQVCYVCFFDASLASRGSSIRIYFRGNICAKYYSYQLDSLLSVNRYLHKLWGEKIQTSIT